MKAQLSHSCIQWAHQYFLRSANLNGGSSTVAASWIWTFGKVAGEVHNYLESGHLMAETLPDSLVHEILELAESSYARFPEGDARRVLIDKWTGLAHVYGAAGSSANREMNRLVMVTYWAEAIEALQYCGFPGLRRMAASYPAERRRLDLTRLRPGQHSFKYVGALLDLLNLYESRTKSTRGALVQKHRGAATKKPTACRGDAIGDQRHVGVATPTVEKLANELYGNWRDHGRNTLPHLA
ncbi:UNVERIFIED_ORG: hypothetical protein J2X79_001969 [Arthrobacter globiformis]|nr:hypothetical protein [Arthrobacter globiformis]